MDDSENMCDKIIEAKAQLNGKETKNISTNSIEKTNGKL